MQTSLKEDKKGEYLISRERLYNQYNRDNEYVFSLLDQTLPF